MKSQKGFTVVELLIALVMVVGIPAVLYGWVENIIKLYHMAFTPVTDELVCRVVGIFMAPLGVVMGYL